MPMLSGTASTSPIADATAVPYMNGTAPNVSVFGSQRVPVTNPHASCEKIGHACLVVKYAISARIASTDKPAPSAAPRNERSTQTSLDRRRAEPSSSRAPVVAMVVTSALRGDLHLAQLSLSLGDEPGRERRVSRVLRHALAVRVDEREEVLQG